MKISRTILILLFICFINSNKKNILSDVDNSKAPDTPEIKPCPDVESLKKEITKLTNENKKLHDQLEQTDKQNGKFDNELYKHIQMQVQELFEKFYSLTTKNYEINEKLKNISNNIDNHGQDISQILKDGENLKQRVFILEKQNEKEKISRKIDKLGKNTNTQIFEPDCVNRLSCSVCLEDPKCVWCNLSKRCTLGDMSGPYDGSCSDIFSYTSCSESTCDIYKTCTECIQNVKCGWCDTDKICIEGNLDKPSGIYCAKDKYTHLHNQGRCSSHLRFIKK